MKEYREKIQKRLMVFSITLIITGIATMMFGNILPEISGNHVLDFASGVIMGMLMGVMLVLVFFVVKMLMALREEKKLREMYIKETDERSALIYQKIGGDYAQIQGIGQYLIAIVIIFMGYYEAGVILFGITVIEFVVRICMKFYYHKTM